MPKISLSDRQSGILDSLVGKKNSYQKHTDNATENLNNAIRLLIDCDFEDVEKIEIINGCIEYELVENVQNAGVVRSQ